MPFPQLLSIIVAYVGMHHLDYSLMFRYIFIANKTSTAMDRVDMDNTHGHIKEHRLFK